MHRPRANHWRLTALVLLALLLSGCLTDSDSPQACKYAVTQDLDAGRYDRVLERVDSRACQAGMTEHEREINRAAAYIGKAGYDLAEIVNVALGVDRPPEGVPQALHILRQLRGLGSTPRSLHFLDLAARSHGRMVEAFSDRLNEACRRANRHLLNDLQRDACFISGVFAYARFVRSLDLLLGDALNLWLSDEELTCDNDRNGTGVLDQAEMTSCAIHASTRLGNGSGTCQAEGTHNGLATGAVGWSTLPAHGEMSFMESGNVFANLSPVRITVEPGEACAGSNASRGIRMIQEEDPRASVAISDGFCRTEITRSCSAANPDSGCWPCPIPRADRFGAITMADMVLDSMNTIAEHAFGVMPEEELERSRSTLEDVRNEICDGVAGTEDSCPTRDDGSTLINHPAIEDYLRR